MRTDMSFYAALRHGGRDIDARAKLLRPRFKSFCEFYSDAAQQAALYQCAEQLMDEIIEDTGYVAELDAEGTDEAQCPD